jgi:predicted HicB family RNase H-like nuclease
MITFDEMDSRLEAIGKNRAWLADESGRSPSSIRSALAPAASPKQRSKLLQKALSDAIEREEERQRAAKLTPSIHLPDRITIECDPAERRAWQHAARRADLDLDAWTIDTLNAAAKEWQARPPGTDDPQVITF